ncbi:MAG: PA2779 family protein [Acidobacteriota bacterium]|nr:PA2779 family protein [Acidobacteriota bacterium]MDP2390453.1 PA2779 family protein [Acidobacteriota bacterium]MDP3718855.1 PA2779 family protein [Acidobacteriota bacterium]
MQISQKVVTLFLVPALLFSTQAYAQQARVVDAVALHQALADKTATENSQRELVLQVLDRSDAREMAARLGLSVEQANSAVATLSGAELNTLAQHAAAVDASALAGGASTIVISLTTLLLILIIVILLAN